MSGQFHGVSGIEWGRAGNKKWEYYAVAQAHKT